MAVYGAMSALGITGGVLLGGLLTGALSWRWVLLINIPIGLAVLAGLMGTFYLATLFMQQVLHFGPLRAGAAAPPFGVGIILASGVASKLVEKLPPRAIAVPGLLIAAAGMFWLSALQADAGYWTDLMVPLFITSAGLGLAFVPMTLTVVHDVDPRETGVASTVTTSQQQKSPAAADAHAG
jgi:MFS family permease